MAEQVAVEHKIPGEINVTAPNPHIAGLGRLTVAADDKAPIIIFGGRNENNIMPDAVLFRLVVVARVVGIKHLYQLEGIYMDVVGVPDGSSICNQPFPRFV